MINFIKFHSAFKNMHKNPRFNLGGGARFPKKLAQNLFATTVCIAMVLCTMPRGWGGYEAHAGTEPESDVTLTVDWSTRPPTVEGLDALDLLAGSTVLVKFAFNDVPASATGWWATGVAGNANDPVQVTDTEHCCELPAYWAHMSFSVMLCVGDNLIGVTVAPRRGYADATLSGANTVLTGGGDVSGGLYITVSAAGYPSGVSCRLDGVELTPVASVSLPAPNYFVDAEDLPRTAGRSKLSVYNATGSLVDEIDLSTLSWTNWPTETDGGDEPQPTVEREDDPGAEDDNYIEATVAVNGTQQRIRVYDPNGVLPADADLLAEVVTTHEHLDDGREIEHIMSYNLTLVDGAGQPIPMPRDGTFRLCFEVIPGLDAKELEIVLVKQYEDGEFEEELVPIDGAYWACVNTNRCSPWSLIDRLSDEEKAAKTGDTVTTATVAGLGMVLVLALGVMLKLNKKNQFES